MKRKNHLQSRGDITDPETELRSTDEPNFSFRGGKIKKTKQLLTGRIMTEGSRIKSANRRKMIPKNGKRRGGKSTRKAEMPKAS